MTRAEHNQHWDANRKADEQVLCNLIGYGEMSQYDPKCAACWLGHKHTWKKHDRYLEAERNS